MFIVGFFHVYMRMLINAFTIVFLERIGTNTNRNLDQKYFKNFNDIFISSSQVKSEDLLEEAMNREKGKSVEPKTPDGSKVGWNWNTSNK